MNQEETDIEALQAQIDLSNSVAFDIVSSWMKPSTTPSSSSKPVQQRTTSRDLEEFARRPPRLGLGATVSKSTTATAQEAAKLKGKLSKKLVRGDNIDAAADGSKKGKNDEDDEEEDSRNTVISQRKPTTVGSNKRVIDVFASASNKKRKRSNSHSEGSTMLNKADTIGTVDNSSTTLLASPAHISPPSKSKKQKNKGKNKLHQEQEEDDASSTAVSHLFDEEEWTGFTEEVYDGVVVPDGPPSTPSPPPSLSSSKSPTTRRVSSLSPISRPSLYRGFSVENEKISLLNLHGPPTPIEEGDKSSTVGSSDKKKRRRKRKKRKSDQTHAQGGSGDT